MITARAIGQRRQAGAARVAVRACSHAYASAVSTTWRCQPGKRAALEVIEAEFVLQFLILLLDRPALMRQADQRAQRRGRGQMRRGRPWCAAWSPRSRSQSSQTSGARRRVAPVVRRA